jgi:hypothetical protein
MADASAAAAAAAAAAGAAPPAAPVPSEPRRGRRPTREPSVPRVTKRASSAGSSTGGNPEDRVDLDVLASRGPEYCERAKAMSGFFKALIMRAYEQDPDSWNDFQENHGVRITGCSRGDPFILLRNTEELNAHTELEAYKAGLCATMGVKVQERGQEAVLPAHGPVSVASKLYQSNLSEHQSLTVAILHSPGQAAANLELYLKIYIDRIYTEGGILLAAKSIKEHRANYHRAKDASTVRAGEPLKEFRRNARTALKGLWMALLKPVEASADAHPSPSP